MAWFDDYERCAETGAVMSPGSWLLGAPCDCYWCVPDPGLPPGMLIVRHGARVVGAVGDDENR